MIVVGTSAVVTPAAGYIEKARRRGARIVNVNIDAETDAELSRLTPQDFAFGEDAATCLPKLLAPIIGELD
jgi:NAD-dependent SIR2 family protein deacetylase